MLDLIRLKQDKYKQCKKKYLFAQGYGGMFAQQTNRLSTKPIGFIKKHKHRSTPGQAAKNPCSSMKTPG
jgi:hypothetical protein